MDETVALGPNVAFGHDNAVEVHTDLKVAVGGRLPDSKRRALIVLFILVTAAAALVAGGHTYAIDNEVQYQTTLSLAHLTPRLSNVDSYWVTREDGPYRELPDGGYTGIVGLGQSIVALPFYVSSRAVAQVVPVSTRDTFVRTGTFFTNSVILGLLAVVLALIALELGGSFRAAMAVALGYALCTYAFPQAKTFFTELTSALALAAGTLTALRYHRTGSHRAIALCGLAAGFGVLTRVSAVLFVVVFAVWLAVEALRRAGIRELVQATAAFAIGGLLPLTLFLFFNWWRFGSAFDIGYQRVPQTFPLEDGVRKLFFTPGKSLLLFAPLVLLGFAGMVGGIRKRTSGIILIAALAGANIVLFSRVPYWAGDAAWGPRYQQIILPILCAPAAILASRRWWKPTFGALAGFGFLLPALLGSLIYFNVWFLRADQAGVGGSAITEDVTWQPFLGSLELLPAGIRDVLDENRPDEFDRGPYSLDPYTHYGYFSVEPRIDFWWLWAGPNNSSPAQYLFFVPIAALLGCTKLVASAGSSSSRRPLPWQRRRFVGGLPASTTDDVS